jgi:hypothetical protein
LQEDAAAAQVGELGLQGVDLGFAEGQLQLDAIGGEGFFHHQAAQFGDAQLDQGQFGRSRRRSATARG